MILKSGGSVGIGSTTPQESLTISGNLRSNANEFRIKRSGTDIIYHSGGTMKLSTSNVSAITIDSSQEVGIGTNAPERRLHVEHADTTTKAALAIENSYVSGADASVWFKTVDREWAIGIDESNSGAFTFSNNSVLGTTDRVTIQRDGNVGIGTTTPSADLEVSTASGGEFLVTRSGNSGVTLQQVNGGDATSGSLSIKAGTAMTLYTNGTGRALTIDSSQKVGIGTSSFRTIGGLNPSLLNIEGVNGQWDSGLTIVSNATGDYEAACVVLGRTGGTTAGSNTIVTDNDVLGRLIFTAADGVDMRATPAEIRSSVDDSSPAADAIAGNLEFYTNDGSGVAPTSRLIIAPNGSVGIGTTAPQSLLHVNGPADGTGYLKITDSVTGAGGGDGMRLGYNSGELRLQNFENSDIAFFFQTTERVTFKSDGNVGIGTTAPLNRLHVVSSRIINDGGSTVADSCFVMAQTTGGSSDKAWAIGLNHSNAQALEIAYSPTTGEGISLESSKFTINTDGNVGIGTVTPSSLLEIGASINTTDQLQINGPSSTTKLHLGQFSNASYIFSNFRYRAAQTADSSSLGSVGIILQSDSTSGTIAFQRATPSATPARVTSMLIANDGKVGIGVIPATDWDSAHEAIQLGLTASLFSGGAATGWTQLMKNGRYVGGGVYKYITTDEATRYNQKNDGTHHFDVAPSGTANAAITFTTALSILNDGTLDLKSAKFKINGSAGSSGQTLTTDGSGNISWSAAGSGTISGSGTDNYIPRFNGTNALQDSAVYASDAGDLGFGTTSPSSTIHLANGRQIRIDKSGNAGRYTIYDYAGINTAPANDGFSIKLGGDTKFKFINDRLGIGNTSPAKALHIGDAANVTGNGTIRLQGYSAGGSGNYHDIVSYGDNLTFYRNSTMCLFLQYNGNVGIGTTAPADDLHVYGSGNVALLESSSVNVWLQMKGSTTYSWQIGATGNGLQFYNDTTSSYRVVFKPDGNVGIGTVTPTALLHLNFATGGYAKIGYATDKWGGFQFVENGATKAYVDYGAYNTTDGFTFYAGGGSSSDIAMKIKEGGGVIIAGGAAEPGTSTKLQVAGRGLFTGGTHDPGDGSPKGLSLTFESNVGVIRALQTAVISYDIAIQPTSGGNVGIGTTVPATRLQVKDTQDSSFDSGISVIRSANSQTGYISMVGGAFNFNAPAGVATKFRDGGTTNVTILGDGNVGIGITDPLQLLHVHKASGDAAAKISCSGHARLILATTGTTDHASVDFGDSGGDVRGRILYANTGDYMKFETNGSERMRITSDGTLDLISAKFKINGSGGTNGYTIVTDGSGNISWSSAGTGTVTGTGSANRISKWTGTSSQGDSNISEDGTSIKFAPASSDAGYFMVAVPNAFNSGWGQNSDTHATWINFYGYQGGTTKYRNLKIGDGKTGTIATFVGSSGNVGIGTATPAHALHVYDTTGNASAILLDGSASNSGFLSFRQSGVEKSYIQYTANSYLRYFAAGGHNFAQNVGINKTVPDSWLHIEDDNSLTKHLLHIKGGGASGAYGVLVEAANGNDLFKIDTLSYKVTMPSGYSVGIGNDAPVSLLHVQKYDSGNYTGEIRVGGSSTAHGILTSYTQLGNTEGSIHVAPGYANSNALFKLRCSTNNTNQLVLKGDGKVGIGTDAPAYLFHVKGAAADISVQSTTGTNRTGFQAANTGGASYFYRESSSGGGAITGSAAYATVVGASAGAYPLQLGTNNAVRLTIDSAGKVGIGTATPAWDLTLYKSGGTLGVVGAGSPRIDVMNTAGSKGLRIEKSADAYSTLTNYDGGAGASLTLQGASAGGNVGIGTTTPAAKLDVNGDVRIGNSTRGHYLGEKALTVNGTTYTTALTIVLSDHNAAHVKLFLTGDWSGHSAVAYVGEYFIQNGAGGYAEPGMIISEFDNTHTDFIESKIVDPSTDTFTIQLKLSDSDNGSLGGHICYHVMGEVTSVT